MINTARQVGTVLGTAILVVIYGSSPNLDAFRQGWIFLTAAAAAAALTACGIAARKHTDTHPTHVVRPAEQADAVDEPTKVRSEDTFAGRTALPFLRRRDHDRCRGTATRGDGE
jgi:hypothetical protein